MATPKTFCKQFQSSMQFFFIAKLDKLHV